MYKLIALDMDGTLLKDDKSISEANFTAIKNAKAKGVKIVLATGRPLKGIEKYLEELDLLNKGDYAVAFNGAVVQNTQTGEIIAKRLMKLNDLRYLEALSKKLNVNIHFLTPEACVTPKHNPYSQVEVDINNIPLIIKDFSEIDETTTIVKIMFIDAPEILEKILKELPEEVYDKYTVVRSSDIFLEFLNKEASKGFAIELLAKTLGVEHEEIICMGDAENDIHMIKYAGLGVAMDNAFPAVKKSANYITKSNEEDGVAHVIDKFVLDDSFTF